MTRSPAGRSVWIEPVVPTRRNVLTPSWPSSSTAMEVDGPPMPVEQTTAGRPPRVTSADVNSRFEASGL